MRKEKILLGLISMLIIIALPLVQASIFTQEDITFTLNQTDYYFKVGENAIIPIYMENTYGKEIKGQLTNSYVQEIRQAGMQMTSSNSQSIPFTVADGESMQGLNFGISNAPTRIDVSLLFTYTEKEERTITFDNVHIYFVAEEEQKQNEQEQQQASSEKQQKESQEQTQSEKQQQSQEQQQQQALQNNQMSQDSSALKQQMQKQMQEQEAMKEAFKEELAQNQEFQEAKKELEQQGYEQKGENINPSSNNTGDFAIQYQKPSGEEASISGEMQNGEMQKLQKDTAEQREKALQKLEEDKEFQKYEKKLSEEGYTKQETNMQQEENNTNIEMQYTNEQNETATISAEVSPEKVEEVHLEKEEIKKNHTILPYLLLILIAILSPIIYRRLKKKKVVEDKTPEIKKVNKPINYKVESLNMLQEAQKLFDEKKYKDAYGKAGQAIRTYISYSNKLNKEITNDAIISFLRKKGKAWKEVKKCFDTCSLVEFAKYEANKKDFTSIITEAKKIIK